MIQHDKRHLKKKKKKKKKYHSKINTQANVP